MGHNFDKQNKLSLKCIVPGNQGGLCMRLTRVLSLFS